MKVNWMVFCKRIEANAEHAVYEYGASPDNLSGRVTMYPDDRRYSIDRRHDDVSESALARVWMKYRGAIMERQFPERMAIQIG